MLKFQTVAEKTAKNFRGLLFFAATCINVQRCLLFCCIANSLILFATCVAIKYQKKQSVAEFCWRLVKTNFNTHIETQISIDLICFIIFIHFKRRKQIKVEDIRIVHISQSKVIWTFFCFFNNKSVNMQMQ